MKVLTIRLQDFRNHPETEVVFGPGLNVFTGDNGQGKTSLLEAVAYLGLTKSFYAAGDTTVLRHGTPAFRVEGVLTSDGGMRSEVDIRYTAETREKTVFINGNRPETLASVIGRFPVVVLSPENGAVTFGAPADRRRFVDLLLSQLSRPYFQDLLDYRRALRQRNRLLLESRGTRAGLESWDIALAGPGSRIIQRRRAFVQEFAAYIKRSYAALVDAGEEPVMEYVPPAAVCTESDLETVRRGLETALSRSHAEDLRRGSTQTGPHRDEFRFLINGTSARIYASQGQHKTLLVALKMAEFHYLEDRLGEHPVVLLDDVFSELDVHRSRRILRMVGEMGQALVTATDLRAFNNSPAGVPAMQAFEIRDGTVRKA